jgi:hypothetical protein
MLQCAHVRVLVVASAVIAASRSENDARPAGMSLAVFCVLGARAMAARVSMRVASHP